MTTCVFCRNALAGGTPIHVCPPPYHGFATCDCQRLAEVFVETDSLPDHVCAFTMRTSVYNWAHDVAREIVWPAAETAIRPYYRNALDHLLGYTHTDPIARTLSTWLIRVGLGLKLIGRFNQANWQIPYLYPFPYQGPVGLVVRQWAEEQSRTLANQLKEHHGWLELVAQLRTTHQRYRQMQARYSVPYPITHPAVAPYLYGFQNDGVVGSWLRARGLPWNPGTLRHLRAQATGEDGTLPSRAALVTTLFYVEFDGEQITIDPDTDPTFAITGPLPWATKELIGRAAELVTAHREWAKKLHQNPLTNVRAQRRAQKGAFQRTLSDDDFDYIGVALRTWQEPPRGVNRQNAISEHIDRTRRVVRERRREAKLGFRPPKGWTDTVRRALDPNS